MLYQLEQNKRDYQRVNRVSLSSIGWTEADLENLVSAHIQDFLHGEDLMTIFTERKWQEEPDIMALDRSGDLYLFELKRWGSHQENLLQVLRYGQIFGNSGYPELNELYQKYTASGEELRLAHQGYFELDAPLENGDFNRRQHFILMTNGLDMKTVEAILYWKKSGLLVDAIVYWIFEIQGKHYIEFNMYSPIEGFLEAERSHYILNTNYAHSAQHHEDMLREHKAAAYYPGWREKIERLQKGDLVFLYQSGAGIVAFGRASGKLEKRDCDGHKDYEYFMTLEKFRQLKTPMTAARIREITDPGIQFRQVLFSISEESSAAIQKEIRANYL